MCIELICSLFPSLHSAPLGPMRYTDTYTKVSSNEYGTICNHGGKKWFRPSDSANVLSVKIISSDVSFPVNVYGTVIARDSIDSKCVYLFRCDRDHCQLISTVVCTTVDC
jgi:hypothetical protein